jgi:hypothetical protein
MSMVVSKVAALSQRDYSLDIYVPIINIVLAPISNLAPILRGVKAKKINESFVEKHMPFFERYETDGFGRHNVYPIDT